MKKMLTITVLLFIGFTSYCQDKKLPKGWEEVVLDGKIVYANTITGKFSKIKPTKAALESDEEKVFYPTIIHIVKKGESLSSIGKKYGISLGELYKLNSNVNFDEIKIGQEILIGYASTEEEKEDFFKEKRKALEQNLDSIKKLDPNAQYHIVIEGETLYSVSNSYKTTVEALKKLNKLASNTIFAGQKLRVK